MNPIDLPSSASPINPPGVDGTTERIARALAGVIGSWRLIAAAGLGAGIITAALVLVVPDRYESSFTFVPQTAASGAAARAPLAGLAQGLGLSNIAGALSGSTGSDYFAAVLDSRSLAERVLLHPFAKGTRLRNPDATNLLIVLGADADHFERSLDGGVRAFGNILNVKTDPVTHVVTVSVQLETPELAQQVGDITLRELDKLNDDINHRLAVAQLDFVSQQLRQAGTGLYAAEDSLKNFQLANRTVASPALAFEQSRLTRKMNNAEALYQSLTQQYQQSRLDAVKDLPSFAVLDPPNKPSLRAFPKRRRAVTVAVVLACLTAGAAVFARSLLPSSADPSADPVRIIQQAVALAAAEILSSYRRVVGRNQ